MAFKQMVSRTVEAVGKAIQKAKAPATQALKQVASAYKGKKGWAAQRQQYKLMKNIINKDFKKTAARAAMVGSVVKSHSDAKAEAAKYNYQSQLDALDRYNQIINQTPTPAPDTGSPTNPDNNPVSTGTNDPVYPTGK